MKHLERRKFRNIDINMPNTFFGLLIYIQQFWLLHKTDEMNWKDQIYF